MSGDLALLVVQMGARACGFRCQDVLEVLPRIVVTPVPDLPPGVLGVINARGKVVRVVDARARLGGAPPAQPFQYLVLLQAEAGPLAVAVDGVRDVVRVEASEVTYLPEAPHRAVVRVGRELLVTLGAADVLEEVG